MCTSIDIYNDAHYFYEKKPNLQTKVTPHEYGGRKIT